MPNRVVHFEFISPEAEKLQRFFSDVFGWKIDANNPMNYGMVDTGVKDYGIQGGIGAPGPFGTGHVTIYIEVPNVDAALEKALANGGTIAMPKIELPGSGSILAQFYDPTGNRIGLSQMHAQPAAAAAKPARKAAKAKAKPKAKVKAKPKAKTKAKKKGRR